MSQFVIALDVIYHDLDHQIKINLHAFKDNFNNRNPAQVKEYDAISNFKRQMYKIQHEYLQTSDKAYENFLSYHNDLVDLYDGFYDYRECHL